MTDDEAGGRREKNTQCTIRHYNHGNIAVKDKPFPSEASKIAPRRKIAVSRKGAPYKIYVQPLIQLEYFPYKLK